MMTAASEARSFIVLRPDIWENGRGQVLHSGFTELGLVKAVPARAKPNEIQRWRQLTHQVTHKLIMAGCPPFEVRPGDVFLLKGAGEARRFYVETVPYNVGGLNRWTIFYCGERSDVMIGEDID